MPTMASEAASAPTWGFRSGLKSPPYFPEKVSRKSFPIRRAGVVFSLLGVLGIALILFVVVAATAGVVLGK